MTGPLRLPLIPAFFAYSAGVYIGHFEFIFPVETALLFIACLLVLWMISMAARRGSNPWFSTWLTLGVFLVIGILSIRPYLYPQLPPSHVARMIGDEKVFLEGTIDRSPHRTRNGIQLLIRSEKVIRSDGPIPVDGRVLLFSKEKKNLFRRGDRIRFFCKLQAPQGFRNPGGFSYERHLAFDRIYVLGSLSENVWAKVGQANVHPVLEQIESWRTSIRNFLEMELEPPSCAIIKALVLGEREDIPEEVTEQFTVTGIAHLLAISGDHIGIVALLSFSLLIWLLKRSEFLLLSFSVRKWAAAVTIPLILLYTVIAGGGISVIRATMMVLIFFLSILFGRERNLLHTLALAAFLILIVSPPSLFDVSFQLSFLAVLSIVYLVPRLLKGAENRDLSSLREITWRGKLLKYLKLSFLTTVVATLGTAPFVLLHFNRISLIGFLTNLFAIPWVGFLIVPLSLGISLLSFLHSPAAAFLLHGVQFLTFVFLKIIACFASFPFASLFMSAPTLFEIFIFYLLLFTFAHIRKRKPVQYMAAGLLVVLFIDFGYWNLRGTSQENLVMTFIDVGQGDSILVEFPGGRRMLIDGGGLHDGQFDTGRNVIAPFLWHKKIRTIDYLVLTHPDPDHFKGLHFIASHFAVGQFWDNGHGTDLEFYLQLEETLSRKNIPRFSLDNHVPPLVVGGVEISFLNPLPGIKPGPAGSRSSFVNNHSLVMKLRFKQVTLLLAGDVEEDAEYRMIRRGESLKSHLLKVPHHGSATSSSLPFLERVEPAYAIFTTGRRSGRLPHPEVLERYRRMGIRILRTDRDGAITVTTDGERIEVKPYVNRKE